MHTSPMISICYVTQILHVYHTVATVRGFIDCMCSAGECVFVCVSAVSVEWMVESAVVRCMW